MLLLIVFVVLLESNSPLSSTFFIKSIIPKASTTSILSTQSKLSTPPIQSTPPQAFNLLIFTCPLSFAKQPSMERHLKYANLEDEQKFLVISSLLTFLNIKNNYY